jgi:hypothetical protein
MGDIMCSNILQIIRPMIHLFSKRLDSYSQSEFVFGMRSLLLSTWIHQIQAIFYTNLDTLKIGISFHFVGKKVLKFYPCFSPQRLDTQEHKVRDEF